MIDPKIRLIVSRDILPFIIAASLLAALLLGLLCGWNIAVGYHKNEVAQLQAKIDELETLGRKDKDEVKYWQEVLRGLVEGQVKPRLSTED